MKLQLNQEVFLVGIGNNARHNTPTHKATVSKIGRKWFYVEVPGEFYIVRDHKFLLEDGVCDGNGYVPEWKVYESENKYNEEKHKPIMLNEIIKKIERLNYEQLKKILKLI